MTRILFITFLMMVMAIGCKKKEAAPPTKTLRPVRYGTVIKSKGLETHTFSGVAQSSKEAKLSFKVAGTINSLRVKVGDRVSRGQTIANLDASDYNVQLEQAVAQKKNSETQIKAAETNLITTRSAYERIEKLYENNSVSLSEYEQAKATYETALSNYEAAKAGAAASEKQVEASGNQVSYSRLTAPFSGIITQVAVEENELVGSGTPVAVLSAEGRPEVSVGVPEIFIGRVKKGQKVSITFSVFPGQLFDGTVSEVAFSSGGAPTYPVTIRIDKPSQNIRPGMATNVTFDFSTKTGEKEYLITPVQSVGEGPEGNFAFILQADQSKAGQYVVKKQPIKVGEMLPAGFEVKEGLKAGDLVATAGLRSLLNDMAVRLMEE